MKRYSIFLFSLFLIFAFVVNVNALTIYSNDFFEDYGGDSWDNPSDELEQVLRNLEAEIGDITLNLINYGVANIVETWEAMGAESIILEEIAGYADYTTFGYYAYADDGYTSGQIFDGPALPGDSYSVAFGSLTNFGFYIDPNGDYNNRMFTEHNSNTGDDYQVAIFQIKEAQNQYILGWEDLDLEGGSGGDRDFQDMIVRVTIDTGNPGNPVPEPASMLLLGTGLIGMAGVGRKKFFK